jgi:4-amino-4-deoxy-L-arabinose transferase-like glycosyltransferase
MLFLTAAVARAGWEARIRDLGEAAMIEEKFKAKNYRVAPLSSLHARQPGQSRVVGLLRRAIGQYAGSSTKGARTARILSFSIVLAAAGFFFATIREGQAWGDDFGLYILHARNIAEGVGYQKTGYVYNPSLPAIGPITYPPIFPLMLAPVYKFFGLNLTAMKILVILTFILSLPVIFMLFSKELPGPHLVALIAIFSFNPYFWEFKDNINSDLPFLPIVCLCLFLIHKAYRPERVNERRTTDVLLISLTIYLAYGTRSVGLLLIPCLWLYDLLRFRRPTAFALKITCLAGAAIVAQNLFFHSDSNYLSPFGVEAGGYAERLQLILGSSLNNVVLYLRSLSDIWENGHSKILRVSLFLLISGLAFVGYLARIRDKITHYEIFPVLYLAAVILAPVPAGTRYLFPIIPFYLFYAFRGAQAVSRRQEVKSLVFIVMVLAVLATYVWRYRKLDFGPIHEGIGKSETRQLFDYLKTNTGENDVFISRKPRAMALFTGRKSSAAHQPADDRELWSYFLQINATYLVLGPEDLDQDYYKYFKRFVERYPGQLREVYANTDFTVYRITGKPGPGD